LGNRHFSPALCSLASFINAKLGFRQYAPGFSAGFFNRHLTEPANRHFANGAVAPANPILSDE
jgi:hypothetical protein